MVAIPVALLSWEYGAHVLRVTRAAVAETLAQPYVLTAVAKGLPTRRIVLGHALRNAMLPVLTVLGVQFGALLGGALILESIFGLPGLGRGLVEAALVRDFPVVQSLTTLLVAAVLLVNLALDLAYARPRPPRLLRRRSGGDRMTPSNIALTRKSLPPRARKSLPPQARKSLPPQGEG